MTISSSDQQHVPVNKHAALRQIGTWELRRVVLTSGPLSLARSVTHEAVKLGNNGLSATVKQRVGHLLHTPHITWAPEQAIQVFCKLKGHLAFSQLAISLNPGLQKNSEAQSRRI